MRATEPDRKAPKYTHLMATKLPEAAYSSEPPALDKCELNGPLGCWFMRNRHVRLAYIILPRRDATVPRPLAENDSTSHDHRFRCTELVHARTMLAQPPSHAFSRFCTDRIPSSRGAAPLLGGFPRTHTAGRGLCRRSDVGHGRAAPMRALESSRTLEFTQRRPCARVGQERN